MPARTGRRTSALPAKGALRTGCDVHHPAGLLALMLSRSAFGRNFQPNAASPGNFGAVAPENDHLAPENDHLLRKTGRFAPEKCSQIGSRPSGARPLLVRSARHRWPDLSPPVRHERGHRPCPGPRQRDPFRLSPPIKRSFHQNLHRVKAGAPAASVVPAQGPGDATHSTHAPRAVRAFRPNVVPFRTNTVVSGATRTREVIETIRFPFRRNEEHDSSRLRQCF